MRDLALRTRQRHGPKHDLWVVPYADMLTLLFAVFVVLYAIGEVRMKKLHELRRSLSSAFRVAGGGYEESGDYDLGPIASGGELLDCFELINAQSGAMKEFLLETLPEQFEAIDGRSLEIVLTDDTVAFEAPLSALFGTGEEMPREEVQRWLLDVFEGSWSFTAMARIRIEAPDVVTGRDAGGRSVRSDALCGARLLRLRGLLRLVPQVENRQITTEFRPRPPVLSTDDWESAARITFAFSNG